MLTDKLQVDREVVMLPDKLLMVDREVVYDASVKVIDRLTTPFFDQYLLF